MGTEVRNDTGRERYELLIDGEVVGFADYHVVDDRVVFHHTVIDPSRRGHGLGAELVQAALDDVVPQGLTVVPTCWYVAQFIDEHPEYQHLLVP